jgi:ankyrin repeat protein
MYARSLFPFIIETNEGKHPPPMYVDRIALPRLPLLSQRAHPLQESLKHARGEGTELLERLREEERQKLKAIFLPQLTISTSLLSWVQCSGIGPLAIADRWSRWQQQLLFPTCPTREEHIPVLSTIDSGNSLRDYVQIDRPVRPPRPFFHVRYLQALRRDQLEEGLRQVVRPSVIAWEESNIAWAYSLALPPRPRKHTPNIGATACLQRVSTHRQKRLQSIHHRNLYNYCYAGETECVLALLDATGRGRGRGGEGVTSQVDLRASSGATPLHAACLRGEKSLLVRLLFELEGRGNIYDTHGNNPLHWACAAHNGPAIRLLQKAGIPHVGNEDGDFPMHLLAVTGNLPAMQACIEGGASLSAYNAYYETVLHLAAKHGHAALIAALVLAGADPMALDIDGLSPLHIAVIGRHYDAVAELAHVAHLPGAKGATPLMLAVASRQWDMVELFVRHCPTSVMGKDHRDVTAIMLAAYFRMPKDLFGKMLVCCGEEEGFCSLPNTEGRTAAYYAILGNFECAIEQNETTMPQRRRLSSIFAFMASESEHSSRSFDFTQRRSMSMHAGKMGEEQSHLEMLQALKDRHCPMDTVDVSGQSLLHVAARCGDEAAVAFLLACGSDPTLRDDQNLSPLDLAVHQCFHNVYAILLAAMHDLPGEEDCLVDALLTAAHTGNAEFIGLRQLAGLVMEAFREASYLLLFSSIQTLLQLAPEGLLNLDATDRKGRTALHMLCLAVSFGEATEDAAELLFLLIQLGAKVNIVDCNGLSALHIICLARRSNDYLGQMITDILAVENIQCSIVPELGLNPLDLACMFDQHMAMQALLQHQEALTPGEKDRYFCRALSHKAAACVQHLLELKWPVSNTGLYCSARAGDLSLFAMLMHDLPTQLLVSSRYGKEEWTCIHAAAASGRVDLVDAILQINYTLLQTRTKSGISPLMVCTSPQLANYLIRRKSLPDAVDCHGRNAAHYWAFLRGGPSPGLLSEHLDQWGVSPLMISMHFHLEQELKFGVRIFNVTLKDSNYSTDWHLQAHISDDPSLVHTMREFLIPGMYALDRLGVTPLFHAAYLNKYTLVSELLLAGAGTREGKPYGADSERLTPIHGAVLGNAAECLELLCTHLPTSTLNTPAVPPGVTALQCAMQLGFYQCAAILLQHGAMLSSHTQQDVSFWHYAFSHPAFSVTSITVSSCLPSLSWTDMTQCEENGWTPAHFAAAAGNLCDFFPFMRLGFGDENLGATEDILVQAIHYANNQGGNKCIFARPDQRGQTPLHIWAAHPAATQPSTSVQVFVKATLSGMPFDQEGWNPLLIAIRYNHLPQCALLLDVAGEQVLSVLRVGLRGNTFSEMSLGQMLSPLQIAVQYGATACLKLLVDVLVDRLHFPNQQKLVLRAADQIEQLADSLRTVGFEDALIAACKLGHMPSFELLQPLILPSVHLSGRCIKPSLLHWSALSVNLEITAWLLERHALLTAQTSTGDTPLHFACAAGHSTVVQALLIAGSSADARNHAHVTPLHVASYFGFECCLQALHRAENANVGLISARWTQVVDLDGNAAVMHAASAGQAACVEFLVEQMSASVLLTNGSGKTPRQLAKENQHHALTIWLQKQEEREQGKS